MSPVRMLICLLVGYLFGNLPSGYLYAKLHGVDIYHAGSGNPGSTNVLRTLGKRAGATVLLMDIAKTVLPIFFLSLYWKPETEDMQSLITLFAGIGAVLGHNYPLLPGIRGGKGVACTGALPRAPFARPFYPDRDAHALCEPWLHDRGLLLLPFCAFLWKDRLSPHELRDL